MERRREDELVGERSWRESTAESAHRRRWYDGAGVAAATGTKPPPPLTLFRLHQTAISIRRAARRLSTPSTFRTTVVGERASAVS